MTAADVAAILGTFLAAIITGLGWRRGEADRRDRQAGDPAAAGADPEIGRATLAALRELHADLADWRRQDDARRRADLDRETVARMDQIETDQSEMRRRLLRLAAAETPPADAP